MSITQLTRAKLSVTTSDPSSHAHLASLYCHHHHERPNTVGGIDGVSGAVWAEQRRSASSEGTLVREGHVCFWHQEGQRGR